MRLMNLLRRSAAYVLQQKCLTCGKRFVQKHSTHKYCRPQCRPSRSMEYRIKRKLGEQKITQIIRDKGMWNSYSNRQEIRDELRRNGEY